MSRIKVNENILVFILILLFPIFNLLPFEATRYYDEILAIIGAIYICIYLILNTFEKSDLIICILLLLITAIGLISNAFYGYAVDTFAIIVDILHLWKIFFIYFFFKYLLKNSKTNTEKLVFGLSILAKIVLIFVCFVSIIGQFIDIGVTSADKEVWFFHEFLFFWDNAIQTGWLIFGCIFIISLYKKDDATFLLWLLIATVPAILTFSALVYCFIISEFAFILFWRKGKRLNILMILLVVVAVTIASLGDLQKYFVNKGIRWLFYEYGVEVATDTFPLGGGFATFGTEMASRYYSNLYVLLGFKNTWAFGPDSLFLLDNYFAGILGQFGFIGFIIFLIALAIVFYNIFNKNKDFYYQRITSISIIFTIFAVMIGSASAKSIMGTFMFAILGVSVGMNSRENKFLT